MVMKGTLQLKSDKCIAKMEIKQQPITPKQNNLAKKRAVKATQKDNEKKQLKENK